MEKETEADAELLGFSATKREKEEKESERLATEGGGKQEKRV